jgi:hypothetical protein
MGWFKKKGDYTENEEFAAVRDRMEQLYIEEVATWGKMNKRLDCLEKDNKTRKEIENILSKYPATPFARAKKHHENISEDESLTDKTLKKAIETRTDLRKEVLDLQQYIMRTSNANGYWDALFDKKIKDLQSRE